MTMFKPVIINGIGGAYSLIKTKIFYYFRLSFPHKENEVITISSKIGRSIRIVSAGDKDGEAYAIIEMRMLLFKNSKSALEYLRDALIISKS